MTVLARSDDFKTELCRLSYAGGLFKPRAIEEGGKKKYSATLIFPKAAKAKLEAVVVQLIKDTPGWGTPALERVKKGLIKSPFLSGNGKEATNKKTGELHAGMGPDVFFLRVQSNEDRPPWVRWKSPNVQETEANVYSGVYVKAVLNAFSWNDPRSGDGISFGLQGVQKITEGERLGGSGGADPDKYFETIEDAGEAPESTMGGDGASGLFGE